MARTDNLNDFLTDVADAIREQEGSTEPIPVSEFDTRISQLSRNIYSMDEQKIGVWVDGKTIYRRVYYIDGLLTFTSNKFGFEHNIENFDRPLKLSGSIYDTENKDYYILPYITTTDANIMLYASPTQIKVEQKPYGSGRLRDVYVIIEYTKTTN